MHLIDNMPEDQYHADPAPTLFPTCKASLSHSIAVKILQQSPLHAWEAHPRLNPDFMPDDDRKFDIGRAAHKVFLESHGQHAAEPEECGIHILHFDDYRKKDAQAERDSALSNGMLPLLDHQWVEVVKMVRASRAFMAASSELDWVMKKGKAESVMVWEDDGVVFRTRPDWIPDDHTLILDYKTTVSAEPNSWGRWVMGSTGADVQCAQYTRGLRKATDGKHGKFIFLLQETKPPYACSAVGLMPSESAMADDKVNAAAELWRHCMANNHWPAYPPRVHWIERPQFVEADWGQRKEYMYDQMFPQAEQHGI